MTVAVVKIARIAMRIESAVVGMTDDKEGRIEPTAGHWATMIGHKMLLVERAVGALEMIAQCLAAEVQQLTVALDDEPDTDNVGEQEGETSDDGE